MTSFFLFNHVFTALQKFNRRILFSSVVRKAPVGLKHLSHEMKDTGHHCANSSASSRCWPSHCLHFTPPPPLTFSSWLACLLPESFSWFYIFPNATSPTCLSFGMENSAFSLLFIGSMPLCGSNGNFSRHSRNFYSRHSRKFCSSDMIPLSFYTCLDVAVNRFVS